MFQTMTQIGRNYGIDAKSVGKILYELGLRDPNHPEQKGFPYEEAVKSGIAMAFDGRNGDLYYKYNIERMQEEFEEKVRRLSREQKQEKVQTAETAQNSPIRLKLQQMLEVLNTVLETGEITNLYRLKADIADIYALLPAGNGEWGIGNRE